MTPDPRTWRGRAPIRVRTTAAAVLVVGVALVGAAVALVTLLERSLHDASMTSARTRAQAVVEELEAGMDPKDLLLGARIDDEGFVQILDRSGAVVASSPNVAGMAAIVPLDDGGTTRIAPRSPPDTEPLDDPFVVVAERAGTAPPYLVLFGHNLESVAEATRRSTIILLVAVPLLLILVGVVTWRVVGLALSPVDAIRAEVDAISSRELHRRVPDPPGDDEIARLAGTMNRMIERLQRSRDRERRFLSDLAHELRSPITTIRQFAEVARSHPDDTSLAELTEVVLDEDGRLQRLTEDLLLLNRLDEGTPIRSAAAVDLDDLLLGEAARLRATTDLLVETAGVSSGRVVGDVDQLERLVRNLTENAARHARGRIRLGVGESDGHVVLTVEDDGHGIAPGERERIFDRFVRLDEARDRDSGGSGLGLAIVREVARFHGGAVRAVDSELGGTTFEVRLPVP